MKRPHLILYFLGQFGIMLLARFFFQWIMDYSQVPVSATGGTLFTAAGVGAWLLFFRIFDSITDPLVGALSDWWTSKGRRRVSLLKYALVLPAAGLVICFLPSGEMAAFNRWLVLLSGMSVFFVGYTLYAIPFWSLLEDLSAGEANTRRTLSTTLGVGLLSATAFVFILTPSLVEAFGFRQAAGIIAFLSIGCLLAPVFIPNPSERARDSVEDKLDSPHLNLKEFWQTLRHRRFLAMLCILAGSQMSLTMMTAAAPFIAVALLEGTRSDVALIMGPLIGCALPCFFFTAKLSRRFGAERSVLIAAILLAGFYVFTAFLGFSVVRSPLITAAIIFALGGPMIAVLLGLEGEVISLCARERNRDAVSTYFGTYNFVVKAFNGLALFITGLLLSAYQQSESLWAIRAIPFCAGTSLFLGLGIHFWMLRRKSS